MAKKVLTPEEVQAKLEKKAAKRKLFFGTFTKALAFFLAIALAYSLAVIAFTPATVATTGGTATSGTTGGTTGGTTSSDTTGGTNDATTGTSSNAADSGKKDEYVTLLNNATSKAAKAGYSWERMAAFENPDKPLEVLDESGKDASESLNSIIALVDDTATISSVVGGFLDIPKDGKAYTATVQKGQTSGVEGMREKENKFLFKNTTLTPADVQRCEHEEGSDIYTYHIIACKNPQKDNSNALHRTTNDFVVIDEVRTSVAKELGSFSSRLKINDSTVEYKNIVVVAEIKDGTLKSMKIDYKMDVVALNLAADLVITKIPMVGKGAGNISITYKDFAY